MATYAGLEGLNVLISRMNIEKPDIVFEKEKEFEVLNQRVVEYWTGTVDFDGQRFQSNWPSKNGVRDELCDKMLQVIKDMEMFMGKKKKNRGRHPPLSTNQEKIGEKRETDQKACSTWVWDKAAPWVQMEELHQITNMS